MHKSRRPSVKKSIVNLISCILFLLIVLTSPFTQAYTDTTLGFSIDFPADWETQTNQFNVPVISFSPLAGPTDTLRENINVVSEPLPQPMLAEQYYQANIANMSRVLQNFQVIEKAATQLGSASAIRVVATYSVGQITARALTFFVVNPLGNKGYVVTCTATNETFNQFLSVFQQTAMTFRLN